MKIVYELGLVIYGKENWAVLQQKISENKIDGDLKLLDVSIGYIHYGYFQASDKTTIDRVIKLLPKGTQYNPRCRVFDSDGCKTIYRFNDVYESHSKTVV